VCPRASKQPLYPSPKNTSQPPFACPPPVPKPLMSAGRGGTKHGIPLLSSLQLATTDGVRADLRVLKENFGSPNHQDLSSNYTIVAQQHFHKSVGWLSKDVHDSLRTVFKCMVSLMESKCSLDCSEFLECVDELPIECLESFTVDELSIAMGGVGDHAKFLADAWSHVQTRYRSSPSKPREPKRLKQSPPAESFPSRLVPVLTFEQKRKLARTMEALPAQKQVKAMAIITNLIGAENMQDEIEVDLDTMDGSTLLKLYEFCCGPLEAQAMSVCRAIAPHTSARKPAPDACSSSDSESSDSEESASGKDCGEGAIGASGADEFVLSGFVLPLVPCLLDAHSI
jgi:hypothetical protein